MIERIPDEINLQTGECGDTQFDIIPKETFAMVCRKVNEIIDHINNQQPKKPKSTNIALRQRIAELEQQITELRGENTMLAWELEKYTSVTKLYEEWAKEGYHRKMPNVN